MAGTNGEEAIVEGDGEIGVRKRVNEDKDTHLGKRAKVEGNEAADCMKLDMLRGLLKDRPEKLRNKLMEDLICYLDVDDIMSTALCAGRVSERESETSDYAYIEEDGRFVPSPEKVDRLMELILVRGIEELKAFDLFILYNNFPKAGFACMLLLALDSYSKRCVNGHESLFTKEMRIDIYKLCRVLPWTVFTHVMYKRTLLPVFKYSTFTTGTTSEKEEDEELDEEIGKKAAENCEICYGKGKHGGVYGDYCSFWESVPCGLNVGPSHFVICKGCCFMCRGKTFEGCPCGSQEGMAKPRNILWKSV